MKYIYILTALIFMGCSDKSASVQKVPEPKQKIEIVEVAKVTEVKEKSVKKVMLNRNETLVEEVTVIKNVASDIPSSCAMWSDGCNVCTRKGGGKASCTTNPECKHKMFSCLQWQ